MDTLSTVDYASQSTPDDWRRRRRSEEAAQRRRRRTIAIDLLLGVALAVIILVALPGLGVVAWFALPLLLLGVLWLSVEALVRRRRSRRAHD